MNCKIPFTKDILFEKKVSEITSISLEHELTSTNDVLKGNFIVSGDFKSHEVSINKEAFSYVLPFEIELADDVERNTIEFMIDDFTYEIVDSNILRVNIDFNVIADIKEKLEEEPLFKDTRDLFLEEANEELDIITNDTFQKETEKTKKNDKLAAEDTIINSLENTDDEYTTYHIHMVSDGETVETICTMYNSNMSVLAEYNDINNISNKDKLIIPESNE